jgi:hypothetical protein
MSRIGLQSMLHYGICKYNYRSSILLVSKRYVIYIPIIVQDMVLMRGWTCMIDKKSIRYFYQNLGFILVEFIGDILSITLYIKIQETNFTITKPKWDAKTIFEFIIDCWIV